MIGIVYFIAISWTCVILLQILHSVIAIKIEYTLLLQRTF